jgi:hypothetical protein
MGWLSSLIVYEELRFLSSQFVTHLKLFDYQSGISVHLSGVSASTYLGYQRPFIWGSSVRLSGESASTYLAHSENNAKLS